MANERLRTALLQRGLTPAELADTVGVDPKTIERWIGGRIPYRRHRHQVAVRLGVDETYLWPGALAAEQVASASESEILVVYPHRWAVPARHLGAAVRLGRAGDRHPGLQRHVPRRRPRPARAVPREGRAGRAGPDPARRPRLAGGRGPRPARGHRRRAGLQDPQRARAAAAAAATSTAWRSASTRTVLYNSIYRADGELLVNTHVYGTPASQAPVMHLRQIAGGTLVGTYLDSFERVWSESRPLD